MPKNIKIPSITNSRNVFLPVLLFISMVSCTSTVTVEPYPEPEDTLTAEMLNSRIAQSESTLFYQCQDHMLAVFDGSLYRKKGARSFELLSASMEYGTYRWGLNEESNEFNPVTKIQVLHNKELVDRFECQALSFYDMRDRFAIARGRYRRPEYESSLSASIRAEESERRARERGRLKKKAQTKKPAVVKKQAVPEEIQVSEADAKKSAQPTPGINAAQKPGTGNNTSASTAKSQNENAPTVAAPESKADAQDVNNQQEGKASDGDKKAEPSNSTEQSAAKEKKTEEKPGWLAWLRKKMGLK